MRPFFFHLIVVLALASMNGLFGKDAVQAKLKRSYHTEPHTLTAGEKYDQYNAEIMAVWEEAQKKPDDYIPALKALLSQDGMIPYFYYDGAMMLLTVEVSPENLKLAAAAMARCDVRDVPRVHYVQTMVRLSVSGVEPTEAVLRILEEEGFQAVIPQHILILNQDWSFMVAASQIPPESMLRSIRKRMKLPLSDTARSTLADWAWNACTPETDKLFSELWPALPDSDAKDRFKRMANRMRTIQMTDANLKKLEELREKRKPLMASFSDEGLDIGKTVTNEMRSLLGDVKAPLNVDPPKEKE
jgi:hypothetical protein